MGFDTNARASLCAVGHMRVDAEATGKARSRTHAGVPVGLRKVGVERREQSRGTVIGDAVARIATVAMLQDLDVRDAADPRQLRDLR